MVLGRCGLRPFLGLRHLRGEDWLVSRKLRIAALPRFATLRFPAAPLPFGLRIAALPRFATLINKFAELATKLRIAALPRFATLARVRLAD